jgi:hypothetical protein
MCAHHACDGDEQGLDTYSHGDVHQHDANRHRVDVDQSDSSRPCDHTPQCDQTECKYAVPETRSVTDGGFFALPQATASACVDLRWSLAVDRVDRLSFGCQLAGQRCALQQSWQL